MIGRLTGPIPPLDDIAALRALADRARDRGDCDQSALYDELADMIGRGDIARAYGWLIAGRDRDGAWYLRVDRERERRLKASHVSGEGAP